MALTADRHTPYRDGNQIEPPVAAGVTIYAGAIMVANATGYAEPGTTATGLTYLGRAEEYVDNSAGSDGDERVRISRKRAFLYGNDGSITQAHLFKKCYIVDDETVAATDGTGTRSEAGIIVGIDSDGIWVE